MNLIIACLLSGAISLLIGFIWYHPKVFGTAWMKEAGLNDETVQNGNMGAIFGITFLISMYLAYEMKWVNHPDKLPSFVHGMYHGVRHIGVFAFGALIINSLFEQKSPKYIGINVGYWVVVFSLIGGMLASFPSFKPKKEKAAEETSMLLDVNATKMICERTENIYDLPIK